jgi:hypothetical protein
MNYGSLARAAVRAAAARKRGPTLYDLCDPVLRGEGGGDPHLRQFYRQALGNLPLRLLLGRSGQPRLADEARFVKLRDSLVAARDDASPDWGAIAAPLAALLDDIAFSHPAPKRAGSAPAPVALSEIDSIIRACAAHLLTSFARNEFIPCYAAFNLIGDPDFRGAELTKALTGLNARTYKNSTLLFNVARVFIAEGPAAGLINPPWTGIAEPMWSPVQIRHRSAYYDAFYAEALMDYRDSGLAAPQQNETVSSTIAALVDFCLRTSREQVRGPRGENAFQVITALVPPPHSRLTPYFAKVKSDLGFGVYVPDCDTTACALSAATQAGASDALLDQPMLDFYAGYQVGNGLPASAISVPLNDNVDYDGGIATWIENLAGDKPYGNDLDPTLNLDVIELALRNFARWEVAKSPSQLEALRRIIAFQRRLAESGAFANPRSHIYYLPELYCAYFGRCYAAFQALPASSRDIIDQNDSFALIRREVLAYVTNELCAHEMNPFDAALALLALAKLDVAPENFVAPLAVLAENFGEGRGTPYKAYEWNKMKTPTRILVGGPEVTSAFVLSALSHARKKLAA